MSSNEAPRVRYAKPVDVDELRIDVPAPSPAADVRGEPKQKREGEWLDVRWAWYCRAAATSRDTFMLVAGYVVREWMMQKARQPSTTAIKFTNRAAAELGVSHDAKTRHLRKLAKAGLIELQIQSGKSPLVRPINAVVARKQDL